MKKSLQKAQDDPDCMKARILKAARQIFGEYGYHGTTTRMIAKQVGIDISTLHYHWGGKKDLYEAVVTDVNTEVSRKLVEVEHLISGMQLAEHIDVASAFLIEYLFDNPEIPRMVLHRSVSKNRFESACELDFYRFARNSAISMKLMPRGVPHDPRVLMEVFTLINNIMTFVAGEDYLRDLLGIGHDEYLTLVKDTVRDMSTPAFIRQ